MMILTMFGAVGPVASDLYLIPSPWCWVSLDPDLAHNSRNMGPKTTAHGSCPSLSWSQPSLGARPCHAPMGPVTLDGCNPDSCTQTPHFQFPTPGPKSWAIRPGMLTPEGAPAASGECHQHSDPTVRGESPAWTRIWAIWVPLLTTPRSSPTGRGGRARPRVPRLLPPPFSGMWPWGHIGLVQPPRWQGFLLFHRRDTCWGSSVTTPGN